MKVNCWEYFKCGREPGGFNTQELGVCPASMSSGSHMVNGGTNGGRYCWTIKGTLCDHQIQGDIGEKLLGCINCSFFKQVNQEEGREFTLLNDNCIRE
jgi:hypothetical protein